MVQGGRLVRRNFTRFTGFGAGMILALTAAGAWAQQGKEVRIYDGQSLKQTGLTLMPWGSGEAKETAEYVYAGGSSIRIMTHGRYQGARVVFQNPIDLKPFQEDKTAYLQFTFRLPDK